ncbi:MAG: hypothetical protein ACI4CS_07690 [Candidatus Weimeria sp.]
MMNLKKLERLEDAVARHRKKIEEETIALEESEKALKEARAEELLAELDRYKSSPKVVQEMLIAKYGELAEDTKKKTPAKKKEPKESGESKDSGLNSEQKKTIETNTNNGGFFRS